MALLLCAFGGVIGAYYGQMLGSGMLGAILGGGIRGFVFCQVSIAVARKHYRNILLGQDCDRDDTPNSQQIAHVRSGPSGLHQTRQRRAD